MKKLPRREGMGTVEYWSCMGKGEWEDRNVHVKGEGEDWSSHVKKGGG